MRTEAVQREEGATSSSGQARELIGHDKQKVHSKWWLMSLFAALVPFGLSLGISMNPLTPFMKSDPEWDPAYSEQDTALLDGAMLAPSILIPVVIGIAIDAAWSVNLSLLVCLVGAVMGSFFMALGIAWHSFGLALTGRVVGGFCFGSIFVVADIIAAQFNRRRKATTFAVMGAVKTIAIAMNTYWANSFTATTLAGDYEKMNDVLLIASLVCLGIGFLWSPLVSSVEMDDSVKRRSWRWHISWPMWALTLSAMITGVFASSFFFESHSWSFATMLVSTVVISPSLGFWMDTTDRSQNGSLAVTSVLISATWILLLGQVLFKIFSLEWGLAGLAVGVMPMLLRCAVTQVSPRDNFGTSFGLIEGAGFLTASLVRDSVPPHLLNQLVFLAANLVILTYVMYKVSAKWGVVSGRVEQLIEPLQARGA